MAQAAKKSRKEEQKRKKMRKASREIDLLAKKMGKWDPQTIIRKFRDTNLNNALGVTALAGTGDNHKCYLVDFSQSDTENPKKALRVFLAEQVKGLVLPPTVKEHCSRSPEWLISESD